MCLPIGSCFGPSRTDDDLGPPNKHGVLAPSRGQPAQGNNGGHYNGNGGHHYNGDGGHYYNGNGYPAHGAAAGAEADRKASNDVRRGAVPVPATGAGAAATHGHGHAATGAQEKAAYPYAGADGTLKPQQPAAWNGKVAADGHGARGGTAHTYSSYGRAQPPAHNREDAADSHYTAATATAHHERY